MTEPDIAARLVSEGELLSHKVLDQMYQNPFWAFRFGEAGRRHAESDSAFHLRYLCEALSGRDPGIFHRYAGWLRDVLVSRGMCSLHLIENYQLLAQAIDATQWPGADRAVELLRETAGMLKYTDGDAGTLERLRVELAHIVTEQLAGDARSAAEPQLIEEARQLLSFLGDAVASQDPALLHAYVRCTGELSRKLGRDCARLHAALCALRARLNVDPNLSPAPGTFLESAAALLSGSC